jgi:hypothetical protein
MRYSIFGTFHKGKPGALAVNFSPSAADNCSVTCTLRKLGLCYSEAVEAYRPSVLRNLQAKAKDLTGYLKKLTHFDNLTKMMMAPWVRFSSFGSVPPASRLTQPQRSMLTRIAQALDPHRTHLPVETVAKWRTYRRLGFFPRLSLGVNPSARRIRHYLTHNIPVALTVSPGNPEALEPGWTLASKIQARQVARKLRKRFPGKTIKACPAVLGSAKCGDCCLCEGTEKGADLIIYPLHP